MGLYRQNVVDTNRSVLGLAVGCCVFARKYILYLFLLLMLENYREETF